MKTIRASRFFSGACFSLALFLLGSATSFGQATRTWVSGVGDDVNPCSRTAPCKTFAGAISKTAAGGEINVLDPGGYGGVTITKAMTIDGSSGSIAGVLVSGTVGVTINAGASDVVALRNIKFNGIGNGTHAINILGAKAVYIEDCEIYNFANNGIFIQNTTGTVEVFIKNTRIRNVNPTAAVAGGAITVRPGAGAFASVTLENTSTELSNYGLRAEDRSTVSAKGCFSGNNLNHGFLAVGSAATATVNLENCIAANNNGTAGSTGVQSFGGFGVVRLSNTAVYGNRTGITAISGGQFLSFQNNRIGGNTTNATGAPTATAPQQ